MLCVYGIMAMASYECCVSVLHVVTTSMCVCCYVCLWYCLWMCLNQFQCFYGFLCVVFVFVIFPVRYASHHEFIMYSYTYIQDTHTKICIYMNTHVHALQLYMCMYILHIIVIRTRSARPVKPEPNKPNCWQNQESITPG